jgi:hypothetical protein
VRDRFHDYTAFAARAARTNPTFHAVQRSLSLLGLGIVPIFTPRQIVALDTPYNALMTGNLIYALFGIASKLASAGDRFWVSSFLGCCMMFALVVVNARLNHAIDCIGKKPLS